VILTTTRCRSLRTWSDRILTRSPQQYYNRLKEEVRDLLKKVRSARPAGELARGWSLAQEVVVPGGLFQSLGFQYYVADHAQSPR